MKFFEFYSSNMRKIYNARAKFLVTEFNKSGFEMNVCAMIDRLFASEPSFTEQYVCNNCMHSNHSSFPCVSLNNALFCNNLSNLESALTGNFPEILACSRCKTDVECKREFGQHLFIEVI